MRNEFRAAMIFNKMLSGLRTGVHDTDFNTTQETSQTKSLFAYILWVLRNIATNNEETEAGLTLIATLTLVGSRNPNLYTPLWC